MAELITENLRTTRQIAERYPHIFTVDNLQKCALRNSDELQKRNALFRGRGRSLLWDEQELLRWRLGM